MIFTDLDGTLLDHATYSFEAARPALEAIKERGIPLVFCTSKTRAETELHRRKMGNLHPFVTENGAAVYIPEGSLPHSKGIGRKEGAYEILEYGAPYEKLRRTLVGIRDVLGPTIRGFGDMEVTEVAGLCGFSEVEAELAMRREYDEPFVVGKGIELEAVTRLAWDAGLRVVLGGRFFHLMGANDKGRAVSELRDLYKRESGAWTSIALGDSPNDLSMLRAVDIPILVQKPGGTYDSGINIPGLVFAHGVGPEGWSAAVLDILAKNVLFLKKDTLSNKGGQDG